MTPRPLTTLVVGGTGKTGRRVARRLAHLGVPVTISSRSTAAPFDWTDTSTWTPAVRGVHAVYVAFAPDLAVPGTAETISAFAELAVSSGVRRIVLLSGRGEPEAQRCEQAVQGAGAEWTIVRSSWFDQNFDEGYLLEPVLAGELALPAGELAEPFIDVDDIAEVAVAALTDSRHAGEVYEVTGPRLLTFDDVCATISAATGRDVRYLPITVEQCAAYLAGQGVPTDEVELLSYLFGEVLDGRNAYVSDGVERAIGRAPIDFTDYARRVAAAGAWSPAQSAGIAS